MSVKMESSGVLSKRGLRKFIKEVSTCESKEREEKRVAKEMLNIKNKFAHPKQLKSYDRKKYVWKLVYIYMLGYPVDFGHIECLNLMSSADPSEKHVGYVSLGVMLSRDYRELTKMAANTARADLKSRQPFAQSLALNFVGNSCEVSLRSVFL